MKTPSIFYLHELTQAKCFLLSSNETTMKFQFERLMIIKFYMFSVSRLFSIKTNERKSVHSTNELNAKVTSGRRHAEGNDNGWRRHSFQSDICNQISFLLYMPCMTFIIDVNRVEKYAISSTDKKLFSSLCADFIFFQENQQKFYVV